MGSGRLAGQGRPERTQTSGIVLVSLVNTKNAGRLCPGGQLTCPYGRPSLLRTVKNGVVVVR